jgi:hypothetical protein
MPLYCAKFGALADEALDLVVRDFGFSGEPV